MLQKAPDHGDVPGVLISNRGCAVLVDEDVWGWARRMWWTCDVRKRNGKHTGVLCKEGGKVVRLHRAVMDPPADLEIDHIDRDPHNNRRSNLRLATRAQNMANLGPQGGISGYKGVYWKKESRKNRGGWYAQIEHEGKTYGRGTFANVHLAALAYNQMAREMKDEFAYLNDIPVMNSRSKNGESNERRFIG